MNPIENNLKFKRIGMEVANNGYLVFFVNYKHIPLVTMQVISKKDHTDARPGDCTCASSLALVMN